MKQYELSVGQPVWWKRKRDYPDGFVKDVKRAAFVILPPNYKNGLVGIALRRQWGDEWYPMWLSPRQLTVRDMTTETIPSRAVGCQAFGIDWMTRAEMSQAIPPAYTKWIGLQLLAILESEAIA